MIDTAFFILSKLVGLFLLVESWLLLGLALTAIALWRGAVKPAFRALLVTLVVFLVVLSPATDLLLYQIEKAHPTRPQLKARGPVHGIILLGGSVIPYHTHHWQMTELNEAGERIVQTLRLARRYPDASILITGGSVSPLDVVRTKDIRSEAAMSADLLIDLGLEKDRLLLEEKSRNTAENATLSAKLAGQEISEHWILVTSAFHMPRSVRSFEKAGWSNLTPYPVDHRTDPSSFASDWYPAGKLDRANLVIKELVGLVVYTVTGR